MAVRLSGLRAGRPLPHQEDFWYSFLLEAESTPGPECRWKDEVNWKIRLIGTRTRDFPACSIMSQPATLPLLVKLYATAGDTLWVWVVAYFESLLLSVIYSVGLYDEKWWTEGKSKETVVAESGYYPGIYFPGGNEDYHEKSQSEQRLFRSRFQPKTCRIRVYRVTATLTSSVSVGGIMNNTTAIMTSVNLYLVNVRLTTLKIITISLRRIVG
jgi:hypothetical protein